MHDPAPLPPWERPEWHPAAAAAVAERPTVLAREASRAAPPRPPAGRFLVTFLLLSAISSLPLVLFETPSINDLSNHLARVRILSDPAPFREFYEVRWAPLPNLAFDVLVGALSSLMPLPVAGRVFLGLVLLQLALGAAVLHRQLFGRWALWPCAAFACLYGRPLMSGTVGYLFGVGLCLFAIALWFAARRRPAWQRLAIGVPVTLALFFSHCMAFAVYGLVVFSAEVTTFLSARGRARRQNLPGLAVTAAQGIAPLLVLLLLNPAGGSTHIAYRSLWNRVEAFATPFVSVGGAWDFAMLGLLAAVVVVALWTRCLRMPCEILVALVVLTVAQLLMPNVILTLEGADRRLPIVIALLFLGGTRLDLRPGPRARAAAVAFLLLSVGRIVRLAEAWEAGEPAYEDVREVMAAVEPHSKVLSAWPGDAFDTIARPGIAVYYLPVWETVQRGGYNSRLFAFPTQQPLRRTPEYERLELALPCARVWECCVEGDALTAAEMSALKRYDYVVFVKDRPFTMNTTAGLALLRDEPCAKLFRVLR